MAGADRAHRLSDLARAGFQELSESRERLGMLAETLDIPVGWLLEKFSLAGDPDAALGRVLDIAERHPDVLGALDREQGERLALLVGASPALGDFFCRQPTRLDEVLAGGGRLVSEVEAKGRLLDAVAGLESEPAWNALRVRYRELLAEVMLFDLLEGRRGDPLAPFDEVAASLSALASGALEAGLAIARADLAAGADGGAPVPAERLAATRIAVVAMGKCGANELNVVSDVDVVFVVETVDPEIVDGDALIRVGTRLASEMMRAAHDPAFEPPLWQVDPNLRPEGRHGPLVRSLGSMMNYYERWAKAWEFQALLKARAIAGDIELGEEFVARTRAMVWASGSREDFVGSVQRMRQRVTEHIGEGDLEYQLKLGPGGLRDIEFSVQLLQLVHGQYDDRLHLRGTLPALHALVEGGYVARGDGERLAADYRRLRVLEHRLQLRDLRRTALMPRDEEGLRVLARSSGLARGGDELRRLWEATKREVRELHLKIFYAPLLSAVAALPEEELILGSDEARARLASIGFRDPDGAMRHLTALTRGTSRRARIQRNLMPVLLQWLAEGTDPDFGLLAFRRVSEANLETPWYLRLLRDGAEAAERLTQVLSNSKYAAELLESIPEAVAWLEKDESLRPSALPTLLEEMRALASRRESIDDAAAALRAVHRREVLRLAMGRLVDVIDDAEVALGLDAAHTALLDGLLLALVGAESRAGQGDRGAGESGAAAVELALIGMGRYGGRELGFASDIDIMAVYRAEEGVPAEAAARTAQRLISELRRLVSDPRFPVDLDFDLRPEGKSGPVARSLASYRSYYERWSLTWEAQALLRARPVAGSPGLGAAFVELADEIRFPSRFGENEVREVRRMKARVEAERLPHGADPKRHLKLGPGGISDVEWLVQLLQLRHGAEHAELRTVSTLSALAGADELGLIDAEGREALEEAWIFASQVRSALKLWTDRASDVLPFAREDLEGIAGVLGLPRGRTSELEERWLALSRRARAVFERAFFGFGEEDERFPAY
ncbi:bifunctional [glutamine synthetase] adenylyltransferase/[glutamine synthetase]-adenylyl-L-tyrosine phosphorylase [Leucobacter sp. CSA1]|uniref:Bifunctional [glutamine synthetase] adenylyltransferase/[glutamine synthetase]-adenylyl-L-tyrosine phosphorylase n=1 Tax=Leucobacter chromiisoli TaxID=2796471 RepID=A0A934UTU0_9MICO|nr:bifunctional [glutamine synthetase] adenylyltransferase/[glutamine synthetase]-adenylyl-L-tyrosine phosphorylase [Leucobacter chromiisoli]MBK0418100.1 bifunctional [glutamine synthetase] adenylyltransferase/[glutamine synthetase]-adenylyl-L-tyrosine phosphorylase [Leucobacter chromiisoli]